MAFWSWWITPIAEPKRYDTKFFLTCLRDDEHPAIQHDQSETVAHRWIQPAEAIELHHHDDFFLAPPTYLTLRELAQFSDLDRLFAHAQSRKVLPIMPVHRKDRGEFEILLPSHPDHPDVIPVLETTRVVLQDYRWHMD